MKSILLAVFVLLMLSGCGGSDTGMTNAILCGIIFVMAYVGAAIANACSAINAKLEKLTDCLWEINETIKDKEN